MARSLHKLTAVQVRALPPGKHADGGGLWLWKREDGGGQWVLRVSLHGRRREMGLGSLSEVGLKEARRAAEEQRALVRSGKDPIKERERTRREAARSLHLLVDVARDAFESRKAELKGDGMAGRWFSPLELHVLPKLGRLPVGEISQTDIRDTLAPIWHEKADTARKAMNRLSIVLRHAAALGPEVDLRAPGKARALLGKSRGLVRPIDGRSILPPEAVAQDMEDAAQDPPVIHPRLAPGSREERPKPLHLRTRQPELSAHAALQSRGACIS